MAVGVDGGEDVPVAKLLHDEVSYRLALRLREGVRTSV